jgi:hypothetical protein
VRAARSVSWLVSTQLEQPPSRFLAKPNPISPSHHQIVHDWPLRAKLSLTGALRTYQSCLKVVARFASCMNCTWGPHVTGAVRNHPIGVVLELSFLSGASCMANELEKHSGTPALSNKLRTGRQAVRMALTFYLAMSKLQPRLLGRWVALQPCSYQTIRHCPTFLIS